MSDGGGERSGECFWVDRIKGTKLVVRVFAGSKEEYIMKNLKKMSTRLGER